MDRENICDECTSNPEERLESSTKLMDTHYRRYATFRDWPSQMSDPVIISRAGFYYEGHDTSVKCFSCHCVVHNASEKDIWQNHLKANRHCAFLAKKMNRQYINEACKMDNHKDMLCKVCLDNAVSRVLVKCGHVFCEDCSKRCVKCPYCREKISFVQKLFF